MHEFLKSVGFKQVVLVTFWTCSRHFVLGGALCLDWTMTAADVERMLRSGEMTVVRSVRRKKTYSLQPTADGWKLAVPQRFNVAANLDGIARLLERAQRRRALAPRSDDELRALAEELNSRYFDDGIEPGSVRWVANQRRRFASASGLTGDIRVSHRLRNVPRWVLEAVLVHELAHLRHLDHSPAFRALANRHPKAEEAEVFLEGFAHGEDAAEAAARQS